MDDPVFKQKYEKYKLRVKLWEKDFKKKHGRIPSKYDIREASHEIRDSYKMYYKLKTSFLEDTLNGVLDDDGFDVLEMTQNENENEPDADADGTHMHSDDAPGGPQLPADIGSVLLESAGNEVGFSNLTELPKGQALSNLVNVSETHVLREFEAVEEFRLNEKAWGSSVSKKPPPTKAAEPHKSFKANLNPKLFQSKSFALRNPRKSLSSRLNSSQHSAHGSGGAADAFGAKPDELPDLETILIKKARERQAAAAIIANPMLASGDKIKDSPRIQVDEGWLQRTAAQNGLKPEKSHGTPKSTATTKAAVMLSSTPRSSFGMSNIDMTKIKQFNESQKPPVAATTPAAADTTPPTSYSSPPKQNAVECPESSDDSDAMVEESGDEGDAQEYRHISKRRRIMPSNGSTAPSQTAAETIPENPKSPAVAKAAEKSEETAYVYDDGAFSTDDDKEKDADFVMESKGKAKRRKSTAVKAPATPSLNPKKPRAKKTAAKAEKPKEKTAKPKEKPTKAPAKAPQRKRISKAEAKAAAAAAAEEPPEEQPLNPKDLKYSLALECTEIVTVPRVRYDDLDAADNLAKQYINTIHMPGASASAARPTGAVDAKRAAARKKLEDKIASGKLNENFVTINIQKKTFVRGKKTVNFSKYKKKMWKNKKRIAALTGPDMDMGGCDGGVLTCFNCGQVGHFAQNCKIKGDALLPLTAQLEEDPSPFPTLEEAEQMAAHKALAVHSRNIAKLPATNNPAIYQEQQADDVPTEQTEDKQTMRSDAAQTGDSSERDAEDAEDSSEDDGDNDHGDDDDDDDGHNSEFVIETDDELDNMDLDEAVAKTVSPIKQYVGHKIPEEFLKKAGLSGNDTAVHAAGVGALYDLNDDGSVKDVPPEVMEALHMFGHSDFRKGQDRAVMRILSGMSTLVTLSTGSGKSLCYQLPAYLYSRQKKSITLVISPLVSLMEDQVTGVPHFLRAHCLHTNQTAPQRAKILQLIADGEIDILLVSPEAVVAGERSTGFGSILRQLPPIAFACIDEAHCVSQWSHNFRPSYLMICKVLKKNLGVQTVLGLTATATLPTRLSIINHLGIPDGERGIISDVPLPDNLLLSVSKDENRDHALIELLFSKRFEECQSIIIYCTRRDECERVAGFIRTYMQDRVKQTVGGEGKKRKRVNWNAEPYHAGMPASRRRTIQKAFMGNELRIVVATIAFGMGINKPDIRAVIHYNMPRNFESYVQEIGRAGRDGKQSHCHLFLDARGNDPAELRRHIYANSIDRHVIRKLLSRIFVPCSCRKQPTGSQTGAMLPSGIPNNRICPGHETGFSIAKTVEALDIPEENIATLLCYMELDSRWNINVLSSAYIMAKVISYGGVKYLKHAAKECPPLAMAIALQMKSGDFKEDTNVIEFSVIDVAAAIGWNSGVVKYQLKNLEWVQVNGYPKRAPINVSFSDLGLRIKAPGDFTADEIDDALDTLYNRSVKQELTQLIQLQYVHQGLSSVSYNNFSACSNANYSHDRSDQLKAIIRDYFQNDYPKDLKLEADTSNVPDDHIAADVHAMISMYPENNFSGRNIARIFHGITSPNFPAVIWGRCKYWRALTQIDFNRIVKLANEIIVKRRYN